MIFVRIRIPGFQTSLKIPRHRAQESNWPFYNEKGTLWALSYFKNSPLWIELTWIFRPIFLLCTAWTVRCFLTHVLSIKVALCFVVTPRLHSVLLYTRACYDQLCPRGYIYPTCLRHVKYLTYWNCFVGHSPLPDISGVFQDISHAVAMSAISGPSVITGHEASQRDGSCLFLRVALITTPRFYPRNTLLSW